MSPSRPPVVVIQETDSAGTLKKQTSRSQKRWTTKTATPWRWFLILICRVAAK